MVIVDTSVIIQMLRGEKNKKVALFQQMVEQDMPFAISAYTYMEVLRGARDDRHLQVLREYLSTQEILQLPSELATFDRVAQVFYDLKKKGITPRGAIDVFIALTAIHYCCPLLHNDKDYDNMARHLSDLKIFK